MGAAYAAGTAVQDGLCPSMCPGAAEGRVAGIVSLDSISLFKKRF
jgi:hypothetical protein